MVLSTGATALAAMVSISQPLTLCIKLLFKGAYFITAQCGAFSTFLPAFFVKGARRSTSVIVGNLSGEVQNLLEGRYIPGENEENDDDGNKANDGAATAKKVVDTIVEHAHQEKTENPVELICRFTSFNSSTEALLGRCGSRPGASKADISNQTVLSARGMSLRSSQTNAIHCKDVNQLFADDQRGIFDRPTGKDILEVECQERRATATGGAHDARVGAGNVTFDVLQAYHPPFRGDPLREHAIFTSPAKTVLAMTAHDDAADELQRLHEEEVLAGDMTPCFSRPNGQDLLERGLGHHAIDAHLIFHQALTSGPRKQAVDADIFCTELTAQEKSAILTITNAEVASSAHSKSLKTLEENALVSGSPFLRAQV